MEYTIVPIDGGKIRFDLRATGNNQRKITLHQDEAIQFANIVLRVLGLPTPDPEAVAQLKHELAEATHAGRLLSEEVERLESEVVEMADQLTNARKHEQTLVDKLRSELADMSHTGPDRSGDVFSKEALQALLDETQATPFPFPVRIDPDMPPDQIKFEHGGKITGYIVNLGTEEHDEEMK